MTLTESGEGKRLSSSDLSYVPLQGTGAEGEERASSEESQTRNNNNNRPTGVERDSLILPQNRTGHPTVLRTNHTLNGVDPSEGEELAPLNKRDAATNDLEIGDAGTDPGTLTGSASEFEPPDGGVRAWSIMVASFLINGILFGIINTYSVVYTELQSKLAQRNETDASSKASLVGSLTIGTTFLLSPVASILTDKIGVRTTTFGGGALASFGMLISSFFSENVVALYLTYGVMYGIGAGLAYTPSLVILGHYFKRHMGLVNGVVTAGSSVFTFIIPTLMESLIQQVGLKGLFRCLAALTAVVMACALLFKPIMPPPLPTTDRLPRRSNFRAKLQKVVNISIWKQKRYVIWASAIPLALFGYFVPYIHIGKFVEQQFNGDSKKLPVMCIGVTSGVGRLLFGYIADKPWVNRILLQQISFVSIGVLTMLLPVTSSFSVLLAISLGMGLFDGCFISLLGPIAFDMCGTKGATQAIGFLLGMCSIPLTAGPPIAGLLYDHTGSYDLAFYLAGIPPIVGALAMFTVRCVKDEGPVWREDGTELSNHSGPPPAQPAWQNGDSKASDPGGARDIARRDDGRGMEIGPRRFQSYRYGNYDLFYRDYQNQRMYQRATCGSPMCPMCPMCRGCRLAPRDIPRYSESEPLLFTTKCVAADSSELRWPRSLRGNRAKHSHQPPLKMIFNEKDSYYEQATPGREGC